MDGLEMCTPICYFFSFFSLPFSFHSLFYFIFILVDKGKNPKRPFLSPVLGPTLVFPSKSSSFLCDAPEGSQKLGLCAGVTWARFPNNSSCEMMTRELVTSGVFLACVVALHCWMGVKIHNNLSIYFLVGFFLIHFIYILHMRSKRLLDLILLDQWDISPIKYPRKTSPSRVALLNLSNPSHWWNIYIIWPNSVIAELAFRTTWL